jgi:NADP-dependent 3-hydroxy acid dehydrogenase YdfG
MSKSMEGQIAVVAGASMGVGRATAIRLAQDGATVVLLARRKLLLDEVVEIIGPSAVPIVTDVTSSHDVHAAFDQIAAQFGRVDVLINSAGASRIRLIEEASDEDIAVTVNTNIVAPIYTPLGDSAAAPQGRRHHEHLLRNHFDDMPMMTLRRHQEWPQRFHQGHGQGIREGIRYLVILGAVADTGIHENFGPGDLEKAWPLWEADGYLTRMSGTQLLSPATVADVLHDVVTRPREVMMDVVHVRPSSS